MNPEGMRYVGIILVVAFWGAINAVYTVFAKREIMEELKRLRELVGKESEE